MLSDQYTNFTPPSHARLVGENGQYYSDYERVNDLFHLGGTPVESTGFSYDGQPSISFLDWSTDALTFRTGGVDETVDPTACTGTTANLRTADGQPLIAYKIATEGLKTARKLPTGSWVLDLIVADPTGGNNLYLLKDSSGKPILAHYNSTSGEIQFLRRKIP